MEQALERRPWLVPAALALLSIVFFGGVLHTPGEVLAGEDVGALFVPWLDFAVRSVRAGHLPLWNPDLFGGYPSFANSQVALFYPPTWLYLIVAIPAGLALNAALHVWLAAWGMAKLVRWVGGTHTGALAAGLTFGFSGWMAVRVEAGHVGLLATLAWTPWVVLAYLWAARDGAGMWRRAVLAGAPWALAILAGHITSMLYVALALAGAALFQHKRLRQTLLPLAVMLAVGTALAAVQLAPTAEFGLRSQRASAGWDEAARFSMPAEHLVTLAVPDFFGQPSVTGYWGPGHYTELTYYVGVLPLMLALLALRTARFRRPAAYFALLAGGGLLLALGTNGALFPVASRLAPVFRLERAPARGGFLFVFGASALCGLAVSACADSAGRRRLSRAVPAWAAALIAGGAALAAVIALMLFALQPAGAEVGRMFHTGNALLQFAVWFAAGAALLRWWRRGGAAAWALPAAIALILLDLWTFGGRLVYTGPLPPTPMWGTVQSLTAGDYREDGPFHVLPWGVGIFEQNGAALTGDVQSVFGYNAMTLADFESFIAAVPDVNARAYDLLNARYAVTTAPLGEGAGFEYVGEGNGVYVYERPAPMPRAWLAGAYEVAGDPVARLNEPDFDYRAAVLLDAPPPREPVSAAGEVTAVEEGANRVTLRVEADEAALLVYSGTYYPGWSADVDGAPAQVLRADGLLRAVCVPAGEHTVTMRFRPGSLALGALVTLAALALVAVALGGAARDWRRRRER